MHLRHPHGRRAVDLAATAAATALTVAFDGSAVADFNDAVVVRYSVEATESDGTSVSVTVEDLYLLTDDPKDVDLNIYDVILPESGRVPYFQSQTGPGWLPTNLGGPFDTSALRFADSFVTIGGVDFGITAPPQSPGAGGASALDPFFGGNDVAYPIDRAGWFNSSPPNLQGIAGQTPAGLGVLIGRFAYDGDFTIVGTTLSATWNQGIGTPGAQAGFTVREFVDCNGNIVEDAVEIADQSIAPSPNAFRWEVADGGNGHWYELVTDDLSTWEDAAAKAAARGGYLATFSLEGESEFVSATITPSPFSAYVGGVQRTPAIEPIGSWGWATGEAWSGLAWKRGEPNDDSIFGGTESRLEMYTSGSLLGQFNDVSGVVARQYLVEWDDASDCNGNGQLDTCDIASGLESDRNGNRVPDSCEALVVPDAYATIQDAIDAAPAEGVVLVMPGTYGEHLRFPEDGRDIVLVSQDGADTTTITGVGENRAVIEVLGGQTVRSRIEGFTITGGLTGSFEIPNQPVFVGGGLFVWLSDLMLNDCRLVGNRSGFGGNAYFLESAGEIRNCEFVDGFAQSGGGNLFLFRTETVVADSILANGFTVTDGGGLKVVNGFVDMINCQISDNEGGTGGGVMYFEATDEETAFNFVGCSVSGNTAKFGGGFWSRPTETGPALAETTVCDNAPDNFFGPYIDLGGNDLCACLGDLDFDGMVGGPDIGLWLADAGSECPANGFCPADLNGDGAITGADLGLLLGNWGECD